MDDVAHPLAGVLAHAADGRFPTADGGTDVLAPDDNDTVAVVAFCGHAFVLADVDPADVADRVATDGAAGGFGGALDPVMLTWLAAGDRSIGTVDVVLVAPGGAPSGSSPPPPATHLPDHPRVVRAVAHRRNVEVRSDDRGVVVLGRGLVGRRELSLELFDGAGPSTGAGRHLITEGLAAVPTGEWCWAQVAAGNTRSLRAFLGAGFRPVCAEVQLPLTLGLPTNAGQ